MIRSTKEMGKSDSSQSVNTFTHQNVLPFLQLI